MGVWGEERKSGDREEVGKGRWKWRWKESGKRRGNEARVCGEGEHELVLSRD